MSSSYYSSGVSYLSSGGLQNYTEQLCNEPMSFVVKTGVAIIILITVVGVITNVCYLFTVLNNNNLRTPPNLLVTNLAIGDLLFLVLSVPFIVEHELDPCFQFGLPVCKLMNISQLMAQSICIYSLIFGAVERYVAINRVGRSGSVCNTLSTLMVIVLIWVLSIIFSFPIMIMSKLKHYGLVCYYLPHYTTFAKVHEALRFLLLYVIPLITITWCYSHIFSRLMESTGTFRHERQPGMIPQILARRRVAKMLITITVFFAVCWLPYFLWSLWFQFLSKTSTMSPLLVDVFRQVHFFMSLINSCANPIIVYVMSSTHRRALRNTFRRRAEEGQPSVNGNATLMSKTYATQSIKMRNRAAMRGPATDTTDICKESQGYLLATSTQ